MKRLAALLLIVGDCANGGTIARIIAGVDWVAGNHVKPAVANLSFITVVSTSLNGTLDIAVKNLIAAGVTTVVAAGNNTSDASLRTPARVPEAITVAATDQYDNRAPFSNFGSSVDVFAPGVDIVSAWASGDTATQIRSGTSSAAPIVAGLAARYLGTRPGDQPDAVSQAIRNSATPDIVVDPGAGSPNRLAYTGITLSDNFNDNARDAAKWLAPATTDFTFAEHNGRLEITPGSPGHEGYTSVNTHDLTDARHGRRHQRAASRRDDTINWESSAHNITWTTHRTSPRPFPITNLQTALIAGRGSLSAPSVTVIFDNLRIERNEGGKAR
ncbi:MAG TPA: S8 family serine peptidase [Pyrinomonadaceae bacterium]|jgi:subtilisin family serine protease|nr:S8 family serine peptidase [Pyrinomonadaceae bacterium]